MTNNIPKKRDKIIIRGARVNNLKNIDIDIPRDKFVVITGLSGSGKSSLAFELIHAEGNRRYLEGMSSYARQFLDVGAKPDVDQIENLSPTISIDQKSISRSLRSTVGTLTEIYDYLRVLFAKVGQPHCPRCGTSMSRKSNQEILDDISSLPDNTQIAILARPKELSHHSASSWKSSDKEVLKSISQLGFARVRFNGKIMLGTEANLIANDGAGSDIEVVIDRLAVKEKNNDKERIIDSVETAMRVGGGSMIVMVDGSDDLEYNKDFVCNVCEIRINEITPRHFSFNNHEGACEHCTGLGITKEVDVDLLIPNKKLSLAEGAILPWSKTGGRLGRQSNNMAVLQALSEKYGFSLQVSVNALSKEVLEIIFYGQEQKELLIKQTDSEGVSREVKVVFEGIVPMIKKKYEEATSDYSRSDIEKYMLEKDCPVCAGKRLKSEFLSVLVGGKSIDDIVQMDLPSFIAFFTAFKKNELNNNKKKVIEPLIKGMLIKAEALCNVGLEYLALSRGANSISGGEGQRIRLATQIGSELMGIIYIMDEPSIGLHNRDTEKLIKTMQSLKEAGNSLIVVEHDEDIMRKADWIVDMGPGAGEDGGRVVFEGDLQKLLKSKTSTADYLNGKKKVSEKKKYRKGNGKSIEILGAKEHNLRDIDVAIPLGKLVAITGVSGSGKSTLVSDILAKALSKYFFKAKANPGEHKKIKGLGNIDKVININQSPIGRTPRSNAATYTGIFSLIRDLFAETEEAINRNYTPSRFSFNMKGGRCEFCQGDGTNKIEMHLLPDMYVKCEACSGTRYNQKTLDIEYQGVNISEVLDMSVSYALKFFKKSNLIVEKLQTLEDVGLGYLKLGQSATNLSGGEAQRIKLATELARKSTGKTLYILDEPTIGLHFDDTKRLLMILNALVEKGNSVLVVEHNIDVVRDADWVIDMGPEGGSGGGQVVYCGTPDKLKNVKESWTGKYL
jgi:excinuclease ABC subunit A